MASARGELPGVLFFNKQLACTEPAGSGGVEGLGFWVWPAQQPPGRCCSGRSTPCTSALALTGEKCGGHLTFAATIWRYISMRSSL